MADLLDQSRGRAVRSYLWLGVICLLILSLGVSLATRTFRLNIPHSASAQSNSVPATRQHLASDAARWESPTPHWFIFDAASFYPRMAPAGPPLPSQLFDESLYNRPPPAC